MSTNEDRLESFNCCPTSGEIAHETTIELIPLQWSHEWSTRFGWLLLEPLGQACSLSRTDNVLRNLGTIVEGGYRGQAMISLKASITIKLERVKRSISLTEMTVGMSALANNNY